MNDSSALILGCKHLHLTIILIHLESSLYIMKVLSVSNESQWADRPFFLCLPRIFVYISKENVKNISSETLQLIR